MKAVVMPDAALKVEDLASYITGQEIALDGGVTAWNGQPRFTCIVGDVTIP